MKTIRQKTFETNSSSTHSITIVTKKEYKQWENGELFFDRWNDKFVTKEEYEKEYNKVMEELKESFMEDREEFDQDDFDDYVCEYEDKQFYSYNEYYDEIEYETYKEEYTTPSGDEIVAFGYYGNDY